MALETVTDASHITGRLATSQDRSAHRVHPYSRNPVAPHTSSRPSSSMMSQDDIDSFIYETSDNNDPPLPKLNFKKLSLQDRTTLLWARKKMVLKMLLEGWLPQTTSTEKEDLKNCARTFVNEANDKFGSDIAVTDEILKFVVDVLTQNRGTLAARGETYIKDYGIEPTTAMSKEDQQTFMERRRVELYDSSNLFDYFLHDVKINEDAKTATVLMFVNPAVVDTYINHFYCDPKSPLWDDTLRQQITTTPIPGLAIAAAAIKCGIDRKVEGRPSGTKEVIRFNANPFAGNQREIQKKMELAYDSPIYGKEFKAQLLEIHLKGLRAMMKMRSEPASQTEIYLPQSLEEMTLPLASLKRHTTPAPSRPMHPQPPPHNFQLEGPSSATGYPQQGMATDELLNPQLGLAYQEGLTTNAGTFYDGLDIYSNQPEPYYIG
ncbi:hypothetical protein BDR07DRAFT_1483249 [Suillus spraguei]|nr:hypothetical protein BDR07DRAFT_1483249 [Suillus spraguei]